MTTIEPAVKTTDDLLMWFMGYFAQKFRNRAIIKGGMVLRLLNSPRATNDLDILFIPFSSKKDVMPALEEALADIAGVSYQLSADSKCIRCSIQYGPTRIQIEGTIAQSSAYESVSAISHGTPCLLAIQKRDIALAHKIAAWNERGLMRDLYDIYFYVSVLGVMPDLPSLLERLESVYSGRVNRSKPMKMSELLAKLESIHSCLDAKQLDAELGALLSKEDRAGLDLKIKVALYKLMDKLQGSLQ